MYFKHLSLVNKHVQCVLCAGSFLHFTHTFHVSAVMSDFPSAEHWWIALGKMSTLSPPLHVCPYLSLIPFAGLHSLFPSVSFCVWIKYYFCPIPGLTSYIPSDEGFLGTAAGLQTFLWLISFFLFIGSLSLQVRAWWWWYLEDSSWPINSSEATLFIQLSYRTSNEQETRKAFNWLPLKLWSGYILVGSLFKDCTARFMVTLVWATTIL